ncbi:MAG: hypothetical protein M5R36_27170 [Deltaproteobacteria bacterium]|nr:hypothetical protein [Deltaproteobacteria bacterium]
MITWTDYGEDPDVVLDRYTYTYDRRQPHQPRQRAAFCLRRGLHV